MKTAIAIAFYSPNGEIIQFLAKDISFLSHFFRKNLEICRFRIRDVSTWAELIYICENWAEILVKAVVLVER